MSGTRPYLALVLLLLATFMVWRDARDDDGVQTALSGITFGLVVAIVLIELKTWRRP